MCNFKYIEERNKLIPEAERFANKTVGWKPEKHTSDDARCKWARSWNYHFFKRMEEQVKEKRAAGNKWL